MAEKADLGWQLEQALVLPVDLVAIEPDGPITAFQRMALARASDLMVE